MLSRNRQEIKFSLFKFIFSRLSRNRDRRWRLINNVTRRRLTFLKHNFVTFPSMHRYPDTNCVFLHTYCDNFFSNCWTTNIFSRYYFKRSPNTEESLYILFRTEKDTFLTFKLASGTWQKGWDRFEKSNWCTKKNISYHNKILDV